MGYGQDPKLTYHRNCESVQIEQWKWDSKVYDLLFCAPVYYLYVMDLAALGFCGRIYPLWINHKFKINEGSLGRDSKENAALDIDSLIIQVQRCYVELTANTKFPRSLREPDQIEREVRTYYTRALEFEGAKIDDQIFRDLGAPAFIVLNTSYHFMRDRRSARVVTNPRLATLGFNKKMDAFTAFQEIAMFLGSTLASEPIAPSTVGDDELIAKSKGFDEQSFRTAAPGQKKLNRKLNKQAKRQKRDE